ncbi:hypothetical protein E2C01_024749 [Portunus trituberculatus]|uniref:Uncharacterized protein n=1 Tax=Portunus trituberculatus TaxID=210409 RepID=A0A5B7EB48_PORTR|nr:hypothetical protein [Portunus trituberculatus]
MFPEANPPEGLARCDNSFKPPTGFYVAARLAASVTVHSPFSLSQRERGGGGGGLKKRLDRPTDIECDDTRVSRYRAGVGSRSVVGSKRRSERMMYKGQLL